MIASAGLAGNWSDFRPSKPARCDSPPPPAPPTTRRGHQTKQLLETDQTYEKFCEFAFPGQCSVLGVYQPELPKGGEYGRFYGFAG